MDWFIYDNDLRHERVKIKCMHDMTSETQTRKSNDVTGGNKINYIYCETLTLYVPNPQNGQTHSNNSPAFA